MINFILGVVTVVVSLLIIGVISLPKLGKYFFVKNISTLDFEETNKVIKENIQISKEWILRSERVNLAFPAVSTFMPAAIAVVEYENGEVVIYRKNTRLMGSCFSGVTKEIMTNEVPKGLDKILEGVM